MFYQKYVTKGLTSSVMKKNTKDIFDSNIVYHIAFEIKKNTTLWVKGANGNYQLGRFLYEGTDGQAELKTITFYNPLKEASIYINEDMTEKLNLKANYEIINLAKNDIINKIQIEFFEQNNVNNLSENCIWINADKICGYKLNNQSFRYETLDNVVTKIRYLGIVSPIITLDGGATYTPLLETFEGDYAILNYYTAD